MDQYNHIEPRNITENLDDSNGRAIWALGHFLTLSGTVIPSSLIIKANLCINKAFATAEYLKSPRAIGFAIKGLYNLHRDKPSITVAQIIDDLSEKIKALYNNSSSPHWNWFEDKLTYANSILPEALLLSYSVTAKESTKRIAVESMDFLISKMFLNGEFKIISNQGWHQKGTIPYQYGEQPIDASYMMHALDLFYKTFEDPIYKKYLKKAFNWFLGNNHLNQIMYNPITGGCYDGLEKNNVNLNQGAESTICYLSARLLIETYTSRGKIIQLSSVKDPLFKNSSYI